MKQIHYLYKITNLINNHFYYGVRTCNCFPGMDPYMGSGIVLHRSYRKYGIENFRKDVIRVCKTREDVLDLERWIVDESLVRNYDCYNSIKGGSEGFFGKKFSDESKKRRSNIMSESKKLSNFNPKRFWMNNGLECRYIHYLEINKYIKSGWNKGLIKPKLTTIEILEDTNKPSNCNKGKVFITNGSINKVVDLNLANSLILEGLWRKGKTHFKKHSHNPNSGNKSKNWIHSIKGEVKLINSSDLEFYINNGWIRGISKK